MLIADTPFNKFEEPLHGKYAVNYLKMGGWLFNPGLVYMKWLTILK